MSFEAEDRHRIDSHKLHLHPQRVAAWQEAGSDWEKQKKIYPLYVEISPSGNCNHRCVFCAVDYIGYKPLFLDKEKLKLSLTDMGKNGVKSVMYAGEGEPLLMKGIGEVINHTKSSGIDVGITTNCTPLTEKLVQECLHSISWIKVSMNAGSAETYGKVHRTRPADFERALNNLAYADRFRKENNINCTLGAQMVLIPENMHEASLLCERAKAAGLDYVVIKPYSQHLKSTETMAKGYDKFDYASQFALAEDLKRYNSKTFNVIFRMNTMRSLAQPTRYYSKCNATPNFWGYVMANGDVYGCSAYLLDENFRYGNINENPFSEIWEGDRRRKHAEFVREKLNIDECRINCRMEHINRYLWDVSNPDEHVNFI